MSKRGAATAQITPTPAGWRLHLGKEPAREARTLDELAPQIPVGTHVHLALPTSAAVLERLTLPATDRAELEGMIQLHFEKTLPYPIEEVTNGFEPIRSTENETTLLATAAHTPALARICEPLRATERLPLLISLFARDIASNLPTAGRIAAIWLEQGHLAIAIYENGKLSWAYTLLGTDAATLANDLPPLLLTAEMDGVPTNVEQVALASDCESLREGLSAIFQVPIGVFAIAEVTPRTDLNLLPPGWAHEANAAERTERIKQRLMLAAVIYLVTVAIAFLYLAWTKRQVQILDAQIAQLQPSISASQQRQVRWLSLEAAIEPKQYAVEALYLIHRNRPADAHITNFDSSPGQFMVEGEAPNASLAIDFAEKLRSEKELSDYKIEAGPPRILPNQHAQFRIFGKR